jgi:hypothetical protein
MGVIFRTIGASARAALAGFLHGRPPPLPRRGPLARLRRGLAPPQLADHALMQTTLSGPPIVYASELDVEEVEDVVVAHPASRDDAKDDAKEAEEAHEANHDDEPFDPLGILREVADAWRRLTLPE